MLPYATTSFRVSRAGGALETDAEYRTDSMVEVLRGVPGHLYLPKGSNSTSQGSSESALRLKGMSDPADIRTGDTITDDSGQSYKVVWAMHMDFPPAPFMDLLLEITERDV